MQQQEEEDASRLMLGPEFSRAKCLTNAEVAELLEKKVRSLEETNLDAAQQLHPVLEKSLEYVRRFRQYENPEAVKQVRELLVKQRNMHEYELCLIANLTPETVDEVKALVPSLTMEGREPEVDDEEIEQMLKELSNIRSYE